MKVNRVAAGVFATPVILLSQACASSATTIPDMPPPPTSSATQTPGPAAEAPDSKTIKLRKGEATLILNEKDGVTVDFQVGMDDSTALTGLKLTGLPDVTTTFTGILQDGTAGLLEANFPVTCNESGNLVLSVTDSIGSYDAKVGIDADCSPSLLNVQVGDVVLGKSNSPSITPPTTGLSA